jgi:hypothetical protein
MLKFLGIFVWSFSVHARKLWRYFNPSRYLESIIPYTPYDLDVLHVALKKLIDFHPCFFHLTNFLESISVCVFFHPCYLGFVKSFNNTNLFEIHGEIMTKNLGKNLLRIDWGITIVRNFYLSLQIQYWQRSIIWVWSDMTPQVIMKRFMTNVPFGVLLYGGLDSSLVATMALWHFNDTKVANV